MPGLLAGLKVGSQTPREDTIVQSAISTASEELSLRLTFAAVSLLELRLQV